MTARLLQSTVNRYQGCWVETNLPTEAEQFAKDLAYSSRLWQTQGIKVIWLTISQQQATLIPVAIEQGFSFHHVPSGHHQPLVLTKRLVNGAMIPEFANHIIGVGGVVLNKKDEVLTIVERHDLLKRPGHWKFPGGAVDRREAFHSAVVREVLEETGITTQFKGVIGFRHYHHGQFGTSNIYFVCHLTALSENITACPEEIGLAQWMPIDDYLAMDTVISFNKSMLRAAVKKHYLPPIQAIELLGFSPGDSEVFMTSFFE